MTKPILQIVFICSFLLIPFFGKSAHLIGGEMTYQCLGGGDYRIKLILYRDCQGAGANFDGPANGALSIFKGDSSSEFDRIIMPSPIVNPISSSSINPCLVVPPNVCVEQGVYEFNLSDPAVGGINLPQSIESYFIVYQRCCRNNSISNIINPAETGATFFQEIKPQAQLICNSTPTFDELSPVILCANESFTFDHSATDVDGNELLYEFCSPLNGGGTAGWITPGVTSDLNGTNPNPDAPPPYQNVVFIAPTFTANNPLGGNPIVAIDEETGILTGFPNAAGQFVVGVCVSEILNGAVLSRVQRDFHFNVQICAPLDIVAFFEVTPDTGGLFQFSSNSSNATSYLWDFGDGSTSTLKDPSHTYSSEGIFTVTHTVFNDNCDISDVMTQEIEVDFETTSVLDFRNDFDVQIFPNPNQGYFNLKIKNPSIQEFQIEILDMYGKGMFDLSKQIPQGIFSEPVMISQLSKGIYFLRIKNSEKLILKRIVVQ